MTDQNYTIPKGWKMTTLGEVAEKIFSGGTPSTQRADFYGGTIPWLRTQEVNFNYIYDTDIKITEEGLNSSSAKWVPENSVIIAMYGNSAGRTAFSKIKTTTNQACCNFVADKKKSDPLFVFFNLRGRYFEIKGMANGGAQQNLSGLVLKELKINLPPLPEQRAIAAVLSSLDDKIELLRKQNKTLETTAQAIFKEWFVNFNFPGATGKMINSELGKIPEGWRVGKLEEIASLKSGFAFGGKDFVEKSNTRVVKIKDLKGNGLIDLNDVSFVKNEVKEQDRVKYFKLSGGDIVVAMSGNTTGKIGVVPKNEYELYLNQRVGKFFVKDQKFNSYLYFFLMAENYEERILNLGYGSAQPNINPSQIEDIDMIFVSNEIMGKFFNISESIFNKILENNSQIQTISTLRDTLLPKMMRGELRVSGFN